MFAQKAENFIAFYKHLIFTNQNLDIDKILILWSLLELTQITSTKSGLLPCEDISRTSTSLLGVSEINLYT